MENVLNKCDIVDIDIHRIYTNVYSLDHCDVAATTWNEYIMLIINTNEPRTHGDGPTTVRVCY
jgi:hypothetical protein